jgi:hypothetical protein
LAGQIILRFVIGGLFVCAFAVLGDILRPRSFAGLFGAAPSVALATLLLTISHEGRDYAAVEARTMICGALGFFVYAFIVSRLTLVFGFSARSAALTTWPTWFPVAFLAWYLGIK